MDWNAEEDSRAEAGSRTELDCKAEVGAKAEVDSKAAVDAESETETIGIDAVSKDLGLAAPVSLPELEASEACDGVTLNCCDWAKMPPLAVSTKLTW